MSTKCNCGNEIFGKSKFCDECRKNIKKANARKRYIDVRSNASVYTKNDDEEILRFRQAEKAHEILARIGITKNAVRYQYREIVSAGKQFNGSLKIYK
jgi:hypothetical protein